MRINVQAEETSIFYTNYHRSPILPTPIAPAPTLCYQINVSSHIEHVSSVMRGDVQVKT